MWETSGHAALCNRIEPINLCYVHGRVKCLEMSERPIGNELFDPASWSESFLGNVEQILSEKHKQCCYNVSRRRLFLQLEIYQIDLRTEC